MTTENEWRVALLDRPGDYSIFGAYLDWHEEQGTDVSALRPFHQLLVSGEFPARLALSACVRTTAERDPTGADITQIPRSLLPMREAVTHFQELPKKLAAVFRDFATNLQPIGTSLARMFTALVGVAQPRSVSPKRTEEGSQRMTDKPKKAHGFAALTPERRAEIASRGGKATQAKGNAHRFTREEAIAAGKKGGKAKASKTADTKVCPSPQKAD